MLPSAVARDLDDDPEQSAILCLSMLRYAEAHAAFRRANKEELKAWRDNHYMDLVNRYAFERAQRD